MIDQEEFVEPDLPDSSGEVDLTLEAARLGSDCESFRMSAVGRFVYAKSEHEVERCKDELVAVDPSDARKVSEIQQRARVAAAAVEWIESAIAEGIAAYIQLREEHDRA